METPQVEEIDPNAPMIVVAEDSPPNRNILVHLLKKLKFRVMEYENGLDAWTALESIKKKGTKIDCIISDIMMPHMDGLQLLTKVRGDEAYKSTPFVIVTAVSDKEHLMEAMTKKVNGYILKPVTFERVTRKLKEIFPEKFVQKKKAG
jgi:two-component system chemotaxis response regulator CheY